MRRLLWANILIAASAAGWTTLTIQVLKLPFDWVLVGLAFALTLAFYTRDRLDEEEGHSDRLTMPERAAWVERHTAALKILVRGGFFCAAALLALRPAALLPLAAGLGFALSYTLRWLPWRGRRVGWKQLPAMKMPFVALLWTLTTVITPATVYKRLWKDSTWLLAGAVCVLIMAQILLNDLRDVEGDKKGGVESLPVLVGQAIARRIGYGLAVLAVLMALPLAPLPILLTALYSIFLLWRYRQEDDALWRAWIEGQGLVAAMGAYLPVLKV